MTELNASLLDGEQYKILRLVMVNSGSAAYVEIPLDKTAALLSKNNKGKTSALNALKLFLLPEVNFKDCKNKFGFSSGGKDYSDLESFTYYFPSSTSFIILEASNVLGEFCILLHQTPRAELGYSRIAVPKPYEAIRHLFWDKNSTSNQGLGSHPIGMALSDIQKSLKNIDALQLDDQTSICNAIYTRVSQMKPETRFCIMPLVQPPKAAMMRSIKSLLQLSFDIKGADAKNLPLAVANIIDSDISTNREPISIDFKKIQADKKRLQNDAAHIQTLKNCRENWQKLVSAYAKQQQTSQSWIFEYKLLSTTINGLNNQYEPLYNEASSRHKKTEIEFNNLKNERADKNSQLATLKGEKASTQKYADSLKRSMNLAEEVIAREKIVTNSSDPLAVAQHLNSILAASENELEMLQSRERSENRLSYIVAEKNRINDRIRTLKEKISTNRPALLSRLSAQSALILNSINKDFECLTVQPMESQIKDIEAFTSLFHRASDSLEFCGETLSSTEIKPYSVDTLKERFQAEIDEYAGKIIEYDKEIQTLNRFLQASSPLSKSIIVEKKQEVQDIKNEIDAVTSYNRSNSDYEEKLNELRLQSEAIGAIDVELQGMTESYLVLSNRMEEIISELDRIKKQYDLLRSATKNLDRARAIASELTFAAASDQDEATLSNSAPDDLSDRIDELDKIYREYGSLKQQSIDQFRILVTANIASIDPELPFRCDLNSSEFFDAYQKLRSEFENLKTKEKEHLSQVRNHNHETSVEISMLDSMARAITNFESRINAELGEVHISNLSSVRIEIVTLEGFNTLRKELENHGTTSDQLMDDSFYERLTHFCEKYLTEGNRYGKLNLEKIIKEIRFIYEINGQKESTSQSNGTSGMVNAVLLSILMRRLVPEDITFTLPVVFDEIGSLDEDNLPELRRVVEANHFVLLVANPNNNGYIAHHIGLWHDIYLYRMSEGNIISKCIAIYFSNVESLKLNMATSN